MILSFYLGGVTLFYFETVKSLKHRQLIQVQLTLFAQARPCQRNSKFRKLLTNETFDLFMLQYHKY